MSNSNKIILWSCGVLLLVAILLMAGRKSLLKTALPAVEKIAPSRITLSGDSAHVHLVLALKNSNVLSYKLQRVNVTVSQGNDVLIKYSNAREQEFSKNERKLVSVDFTIPVKEVARRIRKLRHVGSTTLNIKGALVFSTFAGTVELPIDEELKMKVPIPPDILVEEVIYSGREKKSYLFDVKVKVINLNRNKFAFKNISYVFTGDDMVEATGKYHSLAINPLDTAFLVIPVKVQFLKKLKLLSKLIFKSDIKYKVILKGTVVSAAGLDEQFPVLISKEGELRLAHQNKQKELPEFTREKNRP